MCIGMPGEEYGVAVQVLRDEKGFVYIQCPECKKRTTGSRRSYYEIDEWNRIMNTIGPDGFHKCWVFNHPTLGKCDFDELKREQEALNSR